ncbi:MAG: hypothetical protein JW908_15045 [Anaerolineales bacterium]|nr:hypothetical protein [Anaerolineales bacterium]
MTIKVDESLLHWNYFIALSDDLEDVSRYIEFCEKNFSTYSIELTHLLLSASSEVDVVIKELCKFINPRKVENIDEYKAIIVPAIPEFPSEEVFIPRYSITLNPWKNWLGATNPLWWRCYNHVKHERDKKYPEANLNNVLNAMGGLLITNFYFYKYKFHVEGINEVKEFTIRLQPESIFLRMKPDYFYRHAYLP